MKKLLSILTLLVVLLTCSVEVFGQTSVPIKVGVTAMTIEKSFDGKLYVITANTPVTINWDAVSGATQYEVNMVWWDRSVEQVFPSQFTTTNSITITFNRAGLFIVRVRAKAVGGDSDWARSDNPTYATVDGQPKAWMFDYKLAGPAW